jgi:thiamine-phosphate pyrophosphorylase
MNMPRDRLRLIGIADPGLLPWPALEPACRAALAAGLPALMLRDKTIPAAKLLPIARRLVNAARAAGALLIVHRRLGLARAVGAPAVHLGKEGPTLEEARAALGEELIAGYSAHGIDEALAALARGFDYVTFSPIYATPSKQDILSPLGLDPLRELCRRASGPVVALGGIGLAQVEEVLRAGAAGAAMIRGVFAGNAGENVRTLLEKVRADDRA